MRKRASTAPKKIMSTWWKTAVRQDRLFRSDINSCTSGRAGVSLTASLQNLCQSQRTRRSSLKHFPFLLTCFQTYRRESYLSVISIKRRKTEMNVVLMKGLWGTPTPGCSLQWGVRSVPASLRLNIALKVYSFSHALIRSKHKSELVSVKGLLNSASVKKHLLWLDKLFLL